MLLHYWHVQMLGWFQVRHCDRVLPRFRTGKTAALLAYLAYHPVQVCTRESLVSLLWPEASEAQGRVSLRSALASLRRQLEPPGTPENALFLLNGDTIQIHSAAVTTDTAAFERAWQAACVASASDKTVALTRAVELYAGELLPGHYEEWVHPERARLELTCQSALLQLAQILEGEAAWERALPYAQRALRNDLLSQEAHHALMRLYASMGQPSLALRQYRDCKRLLRQKAGIEPAEEIEKLARQLRRSPVTVAPTSPVSEPVLAPPQESAPAPSPAVPVLSPLPPPTPTIPLVLTPFFGREDELAHLQRLLLPPSPPDIQADSTPCLITLTGSGGSGKTRLAIETARRMAQTYANAVWFVPLADTTHAYQIVERIHEAMRLPRGDENARFAQIASRLARQRSLLILDNFEQLIAEEAEARERAEDGVALLSKLLQNAPGMCCLVTSRRRLGLQGEQEIVVPPLPVPPVSAPPQALMTVPSVQLFVQRAQLRRSDFAVTPRTAHAIASVCVRLEGIPLALELAASRALTHTPAQMLKELDRRFDFLVTRYRNVEERHRTLRGTIDWSYRRLFPDTRRFFMSLSIFRGGWTAEAAREVTETPDVAAALEILCEQSLIVADGGEESVRFRMLETLREYAAEHLESGERERLQEHHAAYFLGFVENAGAMLPSPEQKAGMAAIGEEYGNIEAALSWSVTECRIPETALRLTRALCRFWQLRGQGREGQKWLEAAFSCQTAAPEVYADTLAAAAHFYTELGMNEQVLAAAREGLRCYEAAQDIRGQARMLGFMGYSSALPLEERVRLLNKGLVLATTAGDDAGRAIVLDHLGRAGFSGHTFAQRLAWLEESQRLYRQIGDSRKAAILSGEIGFLLSMRSEYGQAKIHFEAFLAISHESDDPRNIAHASWLLGNIVTVEGRYAEAEALYAQAVQCLRAIENTEGQAYALYLYGLGWARALLGKFAEGKADLEEGRRQFELASLPHGVACAQERLAVADLWQGNVKSARMLLQIALKSFRELDDGHGTAQSLTGLARVELHEHNFAAANQHAREALCLRRTLESRLGQAQCLEILAQVSVAEGNLEQAARLLAVAGAQRRQMNTPPTPFERKGLEQATQACESRLGQSLCAQLRRESESLSLSKLVASLLSPDA